MAVDVRRGRDFDIVQPSDAGRATEVELKERKHRIEDAVRNATAAIEEGVVRRGRKGPQPHHRLRSQRGNRRVLDTIAAGILDPAKVTRSALQNAASIAALFLTTEAAIATPRQRPAQTPDVSTDPDSAYREPSGGAAIATPADDQAPGHHAAGDRHGAGFRASMISWRAPTHGGCHR